MTDLDIAPHWERAAAAILSNRWRTVLVIGASDRGKSSYCRFLIHTLQEAGVEVAFVDADVGQKDMGPPATITLGYPRPGLDLEELRPAALYFVGAVSPVGHFLSMVIGTRRLVDAARAAVVVINTTGLVHGSGLTLKGAQIEALQPDVIIAIERGRELRPLTRAYRNHTIFRLRPSPHARPKSPQQRRAARERAFAAYLQPASELRLALADLAFQRSILFTGERLRDPRFAYCERTPEGMVAVSAKAPERTPGLRFIPAGFEKNLLCGLADGHDHGLGLAIVKHIDFKEAAITLLTPVPAGPIRILQWGDLYLHSDGRELGKCSAPIKPGQHPLG